MQQGAVWWQSGEQIRRIRRAGREIKSGDQLHFYWDPAVLNSPVPAAKLIVDSGHYSVWNKPATMLSQGTKWGDHCTLTRYAEQQLQPERNAFLVHRLDRAVSGLMVIAHSKSSVRHLAQQFQQRSVSKSYLAKVAGQFPDHNRPMVIDQPIGDKPAHSEVELVKYFAETDESIIRVKISTGRKHQIRVHLANAGWPLIGDLLHGNAEPPVDDRQTVQLQLCSWQLSFDDPETGERQQFCLSDQPSQLLEDNSQDHWLA